jgi:hypothetical protein
VVIVNCPHTRALQQRLTVPPWADTLGKVRRWLISHGRLGSSSSFALVSPFPRRTFGDADLGLSLQSLGLTPRAVLIIHPTSPVVK